MFTKISDFIIESVIQNTSSFQYCVYFDEIEHRFNIELSKELSQLVYSDLTFRKEVADVELHTDHFDVVLYTSYTDE